MIGKCIWRWSTVLLTPWSYACCLRRRKVSWTKIIAQNPENILPCLKSGGFNATHHGIVHAWNTSLQTTKPLYNTVGLGAISEHFVYISFSLCSGNVYRQPIHFPLWSKFCSLKLQICSAIQNKDKSMLLLRSMEPHRFKPSLSWIEGRNRP